MKKQNQLSLFKSKPKKFFGGALLQGQRKSLRPLTSKDAIHFVLRSSLATGKNSFLQTRNRKVIDAILTSFAKKFAVRIYQRSINSNHIHLLLKITNRVLYRAFIKAITGKIASHVMGQKSFKAFSKMKETAQRGYGSKYKGSGHKPKLQQRFWQYRPFSRILSWGRDFKTCMQYLKQNTLEAFGVIPYSPRKNYYSHWLREIAIEDMTLYCAPLLC